MDNWSPVPASRLILLLGLIGWSTGTVGQGAGGSNDAMLLLLEQNRNLQAEVQALRALVEEQGYEIRKLQRESLDRYTDTDSRLRNLEQALAGGVAVSPSTSEAENTPPSGEPATSPSGSRSIASTGAASPTTPAGQSRGIVGIASSSSGTSVASRASTRPSLEPAVLTEQQLYQMAYDSAINSQFERAIAEFDQYLSIYPQGRFTTNSHYWKGQSYLYLTRFDEAIAEYSVILRQYPGDAKVPDSLYGQAIAYEGMGDVQRARQLLQQIMRDYPNTGVANLADTRLRSLN
jgi:tol-pal system protein YbgF